LPDKSSTTNPKGRFSNEAAFFFAAQSVAGNLPPLSYLLSKAKRPALRQQRNASFLLFIKFLSFRD